MSTEWPVWPGAMVAEQVWQCPCGSQATERDDYTLVCETCGRVFNDKGLRLVTDEDDVEESPDDDVLNRA